MATVFPPHHSSAAVTGPRPTSPPPTTTVQIKAPSTTAPTPIPNPLTRTSSCRACTAALDKMSSSRYYTTNKRSVSPGTHRLSVPGRASTGTFSSSYDDHPHEHRHNSVASLGTEHRLSTSLASAPRVTKGVIPISTQVIYHDVPHSATSSSSASRDLYSGRPRRGTLDSELSGPPPLRSRPAVIQSAIVQPSSPALRTFDDRGAFVKPNTSIRRSEPKTKIYSVDNDSAKLIAETEHEREKRSRRERHGYHLTGSSRRPKELDDSSYSYTDAAGMFNETEPVRRRQRRGSVDGSSARRPSAIESVALPTHNRNSASITLGPPPSTRQFDRLKDITRSGSVREPVRASSRDRQGSYDNYGREIYDVPLRTTSTMPIVHDSRHIPRDDPYYRENYDDRQPRQMSRPFPDENVEKRGFGIRAGSKDRYGGSSSSSVEAPVPRSIYPQTSGLYGNQPLVKAPVATDYQMPPPHLVDERVNSVRPSDRDYERPKEREYERPKDRDYERPKEREFERPRDHDRLPDRDYDRPRDLDRLPDRDSGARHHHRRPSRDTSATRGGAAREAVIPAVAAVSGVAGLAAGAGSERKEQDREREREDRGRHDRNHHRRLSRDTSLTRGGPPPPAARDLAAASAGGAAVPAAANMDQRDRRPARESDDERDRVRRSRAEPSGRDSHDTARRSEKESKESKEVDPDEEYRRRIAQFKSELSAEPSLMLNEYSSNEVPITRLPIDEGVPSSRGMSKDGDRFDEERDNPRRQVHDDRLRERRRSLDRSSRRSSDDDRVGLPSTKEPRPRESEGNAPRKLPPDEKLGSNRDHHSNNPQAVPGAYPSEQHAATGWAQQSAQPGTALATVPPRQDSAISSLMIPDETPRSKSVDYGATDKSERRVTIVEPSKDEPTTEAPLKGILRRPTNKFPEHPNPVREGVTPLKERIKGKEGSGGRTIPDDAKWTKIDRRLVNPQALEEQGVRFEERKDVLIVLRVLTREEIQEFANRTAEIREERNQEEKRHQRRSRRQHDDETDGSESDERGHHSSRRHHDDHDRERERERDRERESGREKDRDHRRSRDHDDYSSENEAAMRAIEDGRRRNDRDHRRDDEYSNGGQSRSDR